MRESSELGSPKWYRPEASYGGITDIHHRTSYSNSHRIEGKIAYFMEHQPSASLSRGRRAAFLNLSSRIYPTCRGVPGVTAIDAGAGQCESFKENNIEGGSGLLYKFMNCHIEILGSTTHKTTVSSWIVVKLT
jgi:hypothetical protein